MRAAADAAPASDMLGLAVLVALNIADEYFRARDSSQSTHAASCNERALRLERSSTRRSHKSPTKQAV